jgi:hypothetical protein
LFKSTLFISRLITAPRHFNPCIYYNYSYLIRSFDHSMSLNSLTHFILDNFLEVFSLYMYIHVISLWGHSQWRYNENSSSNMNHLHKLAIFSAHFCLKMHKLQKKKIWCNIIFSQITCESQFLLCFSFKEEKKMHFSLKHYMHQF